MREDFAGRRVVKLGGSLLTLDDYPARLSRWLRQAGPRPTWVVVGGGRRADAARRFAARWRLSEERLHWLCVRAMQDNALEARPRLSTLCDAAACRWLDVVAFLREVEPSLPGPALPCSDDATSDSISARAAEWLDADLVLLKSADLQAADWPAAAAAGSVDAVFPRLAPRLRRIQWVNLRSPCWRQRP